MSTLEVCFWSCLGCVAYAEALYPLLAAALAQWRPRPVARGTYRPRSVSFVVAARDEEAAIDRPLHELPGLVAACRLSGEVVLVSDGSGDGTAAVARAHTKGPVRVLELPAGVGKA